ncbi:MAG: hypothetical protein A2Y12_19615 [Planctomycetes bacterium GWF2_42_9]|nr:MAG: hypothetical protein A2Y12_19615 [Planctomycetes bacterium GWF2_42_9]
MKNFGTKFITIIFTIMCLFSRIAVPALDSNSYCIVEHGNPKSSIVVAEESIKALSSDVQLLTQSIKKSTGATIPVGTISENTNNVQIHIGYTDYARTLNNNIENLDSDGFGIFFPASNKIVILAKSDWGLRYGIYEFIERYVGVRWLFPGELGEYIPINENIYIQKQPIIEEPAFLSRQLSSPELSQIKEDNQIREWAKRLRMHLRIEFHHNLCNLFPPSKYYNSHPDWYPPIDGKKICPLDGGPVSGDTWQPIFDAPGFQEESVKIIKQFFADNPGESSISIGINDTECFGKPSSKLNSLGLPDLSDYYYGWATEVASKVLESYPDKLFGCLAYFNVADPPQKIKMNPNIVPFLTFDRMAWLDKNTAKKDMKRTTEWSKVAAQIGWYDYIYGDMFYKIPRIYWHLQADYLRFGYANGVRSLYAEAYPMPEWTEGPKLYLYLKLLWNPKLDIDKTLDEWYTCAVGSDAAPYLKEYYQFWEDFWTQRVTKDAWFKRGITLTWLPFQDDGYISQLKQADIDKCQMLLEKVLEKAISDKEKARAAFFLKGFSNIKNKLGNLVETRDRLSIMKGTELKKYNFTVGECTTELPSDWGFWSQLPEFKKICWNKTYGYTQPGSLVIDTNGLQGKAACFMINLSVIPSKSYRITCWFKTDNFPANALIGLVAKWQGQDQRWGEQQQSIETFVETTNNKWQKLSINFITPKLEEPFASIRLVTQNTNQGQVIFDDFLVEEIIDNPTLNN